MTTGLCAAWLITSGVSIVSDSEGSYCVLCVCVNVYASAAGALTNTTQTRERMSPLQASIVNTRLIDSDRDRKGTLNSCQCCGVSGTAVDLQGRSGQPSRMERCFALFGLSGFELKVEGGECDTKCKRRALSHTLGEF